MPLYHRMNRQKSNGKRPPERRRRDFLTFLIPAILLMVFVTWAELTWFTPDQNHSFDPVLEGQMAGWQIVDPPYRPEEARVIDMDGVESRLSDLRGTWTLVNFWATWCPPCLVELPTLVALDAAFEGQGLEVLAINMDSGMGAERLSALIEEYDMTRLGAYRASGRSIHQAFEIRGLPTSILIDPSGLIRGVYLGEADWASAEAKTFIQSFSVNSGTASNKSATSP